VKVLFAGAIVFEAIGVSKKTLRKIVHTIAVEADVSKKLPNVGCTE
jgi:hypothetical protein